MVRYGILGFGHHAVRRLMPGFVFAQRSKPVAFWRHDQAKAAEVEAQYGIKSHPTPEALCRASDVDAIFVTTPDALHAEHVELAFRCGKPVLCEKPLAMNVAEVERMIDAARSAKQLFGVAHVMRLLDSVQKTREIVASGILGEVRSARCDFTYAALGSARTWITDSSLACGGPVGDVGVHCYDTLRFILQDEVAKVQALLTRDEHSGALEAAAMVNLRMRSGILANSYVSARAPYRTFLEIIGSEATLESHYFLRVEPTQELVIYTEAKELQRIRCDNRGVYGKQFDAFADSLTEGAPLFCTPQDGLHNQHILDAIYQSSRTSKDVSIG